MTSTDARLRIVVVDDCPDNARLIALLLAGAGHAVQTIVDATRAMDAVRDFKPHVVLLDIAMPKLDGYMLARNLRSSGFEGLLVAVSGFGDDPHQAQASDAGFNHYLIKPVDIGKLNRLVTELATP